MQVGWQFTMWPGSQHATRLHEVGPHRPQHHTAAPVHAVRTTTAHTPPLQQAPEAHGQLPGAHRKPHSHDPVQEDAGVYAQFPSDVQHEPRHGLGVQVEPTPLRFAAFPQPVAEAAKHEQSITEQHEPHGVAQVRPQVQVSEQAAWVVIEQTPENVPQHAPVQGLASQDEPMPW